MSKRDEVFANGVELLYCDRCGQIIHEEDVELFKERGNCDRCQNLTNAQVEALKNPRSAEEVAQVDDVLSQVKEVPNPIEIEAENARQMSAFKRYIASLPPESITEQIAMNLDGVCNVLQALGYAPTIVLLKVSDPKDCALSEETWGALPLLKFFGPYDTNVNVPQVLRDFADSFAEARRIQAKIEAERKRMERAEERKVISIAKKKEHVN